MPYQGHIIIVFRVFYIVLYLENDCKQIQSATIDDQDKFLNINTVSLATVDHVLRRNTLRMKQVYRVPFVRNSDRVKQLCYDYVQVSHIHFHN